MLSARGRAALAGLAETCEPFAVVRMPALPASARRDAHITLAALRRAGWHACSAEVDDDLHQTWARLLETTR